MSSISIRGAIDMHCHSGPSLFTRLDDALDISLRAAEVGMRGIVFKTHHLETSDRCYFINRAILEKYGSDESIIFKAIGSIVLNLHHGGLNPLAVRECLSHGGRIVFMPTIHAAYHSEHFGPLGSYKLDSMKSEQPPARSAITVLDKDGNLNDATKDIVQVVKEYDAVIGTSHLSPLEWEVLIKYASSQNVKVVVTHILPSIDVDTYVKMSKLGAYIELCSTNSGAVSIALGDGHTLHQAIDVIEAVGAEKCVISSDAGQPFNPGPHDSMQQYALSLHEFGVSEEKLKIMMVENPRKLLNI